MIRNKENGNFLTKAEVVEMFRVLSSDSDNSCSISILETKNYWYYQIKIENGCSITGRMLSRLAKLNILDSILISSLKRGSVIVDF